MSQLGKILSTLYTRAVIGYEPDNHLNEERAINEAYHKILKKVKAIRKYYRRKLNENHH